MGIFGRRAAPVSPAPGAVEQAVVVHYSLSSSFGSPAEHRAVERFEDWLLKALPRRGLGELDGNEYGDGEVVLYCYGPDAHRILAEIEARARRVRLRPAWIELRFGPAGPQTATEQITL